jgi:hypothetical protein
MNPMEVGILDFFDVGGTFGWLVEELEAGLAIYALKLL